jgi:hypothetical protein
VEDPAPIAKSIARPTFGFDRGRRSVSAFRFSAFRFFFVSSPASYHPSPLRHVPGEYNRTNLVCSSRRQEALTLLNVERYWQAELRLLDVSATLDFGFWALDFISVPPPKFPAIGNLNSSLPPISVGDEMTSLKCVPKS